MHDAGKVAGRIKIKWTGDCDVLKVVHNRSVLALSRHAF